MSGRGREEMTMSEVRITGGCQCGAVRYALHAEPNDPHICHCRMCQKALGSFFAPYGSVPIAAFEVTRGEIATFRSSDPTERGFCRACGTPLTFRYVDRPQISITLGSLDEPAKVRPGNQYGIEGRMPWFAALAALPGEKTTEQDVPDLAVEIASTNHQHPDHDTAAWPEARP
jgi:hypothetical protein